jgi:hypothetical protein
MTLRYMLRTAPENSESASSLPWLKTEGRFENFEVLDWMVPRNAVFQKSAVCKFTFSLAGVRNFMDFLV